MQKRLSLRWLAFQAGMLLLASPAFASFHLMKIEAAMGGVGGDTTQQAIQLRMRAPDQNLVGSGQTRLIAWDAAGLNPVTLIVFPRTFSTPRRAPASSSSAQPSHRRIPAFPRTSP